MADRHTDIESATTDIRADIHRVYPAIRDNPQKLFDPVYRPQQRPQPRRAPQPTPYPRSKVRRHRNRKRPQPPTSIRRRSPAERRTETEGSASDGVRLRGGLLGPGRHTTRLREKAYTSFLPAVGPGEADRDETKVSSWRIDWRTTSTLSDLAGPINQVARGWLAYFTAFYPTAVIPMCRHLDTWIMRWARKKYKRLERSRRRAHEWLQGSAPHSSGVVRSLATAIRALKTGRHEPDESEVHVRICEGRGLRCPRLLGSDAGKGALDASGGDQEDVCRSR